MRRGFLFTIPAVVLGAAACATGSTYLGNGGGGAGADTTTSSTVSTGGSSSTSSSGHTSASSASSTSSTSGGCSESPCKLTSPQCGCGAGQVCGITAGARACQAGGTSAAGQACTGPFSCAAGTLCVGGGATGVCEVFCNSDADCSGGLCALQLSDGSGGAIPNATLCTNNCDLSNNGGCPSGTACQLGQEQTGSMRFFTFCASAGTGGKNATCTSAEQCKPTYGCFSSNTCLQYCYVSNLSACGGAGCSPLQDASMSSIYVNNKQVGVCP